MLAEKGKAKVAIEIQWSNQSDEETLRRQNRYAEAGVRGLWLLRRRRFPIIRDLPTPRLDGNMRDGFDVELDTITSKQRLPVTDFLVAAFARRLYFGIPYGIDARVSIHAGTMECWRDRYREKTRVVTRINADFGANSCRFLLSDLDDFPGITKAVLTHMPQGIGIGTIRPRHSRTQQRTYLSNGCRACGALLGAFHLHEALHDEKMIAAFPQRLTGLWHEAVTVRFTLEGAPMAWGVYDG